MTVSLRDDAPDQVDVIDPTELSEVIEQYKSVAAQILAAESKLKELKAQEKYISNFSIPEIMNKMNLSTVKLKDGSELSVKKVYSATMKADKKPQAIQWLRDNGLGDIVKNEKVVCKKTTRVLDSIIIKCVIRNKDGNIVSTGYAQEEKTTSFVNETSFVENCETSAVGRALGFLGLGIKDSIASADELVVAISKQKKATKPTSKKLKINKVN